jgi:hypothetical protein
VRVINVTITVSGIVMEEVSSVARFWGPGVMTTEDAVLLIMYVSGSQI